MAMTSNFSPEYMGVAFRLVRINRLSDLKYDMNFERTKRDAELSEVMRTKKYEPPLKARNVKDPGN